MSFVQLDIRDIDLICAIIFIFRPMVAPATGPPSIEDLRTCQLWLGMEHQTKRNLQFMYSKILKRKKWVAAARSIKRIQSN